MSESAKDRTKAWQAIYDRLHSGRAIGRVCCHGYCRVAATHHLVSILSGYYADRCREHATDLVLNSDEWEVR
jgi:hypothetical protein